MTLGRACLILALAASVYGAGAAGLGVFRGDDRLVASARRSVYAVAGLVVVAFAIVEIAYLRDDFSFALVAGNSSSTTPVFYKAAAMWSSQAGSLLLWLLILSLQAAIAVRIAHRRFAALEPVATGVLLVICAFFALLMVVWSTPFAPTSPVPSDGAGLQPLLRYPLMAAHPVALYLGYAGFAVPFAFAVAALVRRRLDATWLVATRRFTLAAWAFLALGLVLGSRWSYAELGWGGYWGWDPVENAALLPWLTGTALLHSSVVQEKRGMLKVWNVSLVMASFCLALTGTFLVRSGILDSIHAFGASTLGVPFVTAIALTVLASIALVTWRYRDLTSEHALDSLLSREAIFLLNNLVLVGLAFVIFWGTFFPLISEAVTGTKSSVGPPWFDQYTTPLGIVLVLLTGLGPLFAWRRTTARGLLRVLLAPTIGAVLVVGGLLAFTDAPRHPGAIVAFAVIALTMGALASEFIRGARARRAASGEPFARALVGVVRRNRRRYGGYIVHAGIAVLLLGVAASSSFGTAVDRELRPGQRMEVAGYQLTYRQPRPGLQAEKLTFGAVVDVARNGRHVTTLRPARDLYPAANDGGGGIVGRYFTGEQTSEVGLDASMSKDLWVAVQPNFDALTPAITEAERRFAGATPQTQAVVLAAIMRRWQALPSPVTFRAIVRTGVSWIWMGAALVGFGTLIAAWPGRRPQRGPLPLRAVVAPWRRRRTRVADAPPAKA